MTAIGLLKNILMGFIFGLSALTGLIVKYIGLNVESLYFGLKQEISRY